MFDLVVSVPALRHARPSATASWTEGRGGAGEGGRPELAAVAAEGLAKLSVRAACGGDAAMEAGEQLQVLYARQAPLPSAPPAEAPNPVDCMPNLNRIMNYEF